MRSLKLLFLGWMFIFPQMAFSKGEVKTLEVLRISEAFEIHISLTEKVEEEKVEISFIDHAIHLDFSKIKGVGGEKVVADSGIEGLKSVAGEQHDKNTYRVTVELAGAVPAISYLNKITTRVDGTSLIIKIENPMAPGAANRTEEGELLELSSESLSQGKGTSFTMTSDDLGDEEVAGETSQLDESQIKLFSSRSTAEPRDSSKSTGRLIGVIVVFLALLGGGFLFMRRWVQRGVSKGSPLQIKIIGQHYLGPKKSLAVVRVAGESILVGITDHNITCIKALSLLDDELPAPGPTESFQGQLRESSGEGLDDADEESDGFAMSGLSDIKERVSERLRQMREL